MRHEQEQFRSSDRGADTNPHGRSSTLRYEPSGSDSNEWNPIDTSGITPSTESKEAFRLREVRFGIHQEDNNGERGEEDSRKADDRKSDGFEPFLNQEFQEENLFVNNYGGNFSYQMELDRGRVERALQIADLDKVFLANLQPSRSKAEAHGNELASKRFLPFERRTEKAEEENPLHKVVSVPEGWRIGINDQRITEELTNKKLGGGELQKTFVEEFNSHLRQALVECVLRDKLSDTKDEIYRKKLIVTLAEVTGTLGLAALSVSYHTPLFYTYFSIALGATLISFRVLNTSRIGRNRRINHPLEVFLPPVEIDKVVRTYAYLAGKGRRLVREIKEER